jgi:hypothetical protein
MMYATERASHTYQVSRRLVQEFSTTTTIWEDAVCIDTTMKRYLFQYSVEMASRSTMYIPSFIMIMQLFKQY